MTWSAPATTSMLATSLAEIGARLLSCGHVQTGDVGGARRG